MTAQDQNLIADQGRILPCERCEYDLNGLGVGARLICPECGLEQPRRTSLPPWPSGWRAAAWQCGVTLAICNLCLVLLLLCMVVAGAGAGTLLLFAPLTFLSGPIVPIASARVLARRHGREGLPGHIALGWIANFLIGAAYLGIAFAVALNAP
jgi:hypothetical protein